MSEREKLRRFEALLIEHRKILFKVASIYARVAEDRNDLAQEIRVQLWRSFGRYDPQRAKFSTWMYRIALNVAISYVRRNRHLSPDRMESLDEQHAATIPGDEPNAHDEQLFVLYTFIERLDAFSRALILLYLDEREQAEIADILGISETNVSTKINRIKQRLRDQMMSTQITGV